MDDIRYANTNENLYDDIALWERSEGVELFQEMPLKGNELPSIIDFGYGFGQYLFAASYSFPKGMIYGIDGNLICQNEVSDKIQIRNIKNIKLINKSVDNLQEFQTDSIDLLLLYDILHGNTIELKYTLYQEAHRIIKTGGCLSILPLHLSNWRDRQGAKKKYNAKRIMDEIAEYGFKYEGSCKTKAIHWEKCHTDYYIQKKNITFDILERVDVMNFIKE